MDLVNEIWSVNESGFESLALKVFKYQFERVEVYCNFCLALKRNPENVNTIDGIPFLPISFFKTQQVIAQGQTVQKVFESSSTTGSIPSKHYVADVSVYEKSFLKGFELFYGKPEDYTILALLPSYLERGNSSLVYMAEALIKLSGKTESGFFLHEFEKLKDILEGLARQNTKTILLGVTFGLLDFAEQFKIDFPELIIMETGGMKGRREELTRREVHEILCPAFGVEKIHSEYGMTELLSQGYSQGDGLFNTVPWMKVLTRDLYDPLILLGTGQSGAINIIDLANINSCSFIATDDMGRVNADGSFTVMGRIDNAELRGCNLMVME
ncbi:MAG TPA: hypothetical protein VG603_08805 [Chitinophagales bacterium]|nr:hypothetical protein [Chitinophagales bacterium]